jgi:hypothetical protein
LLNITNIPNRALALMTQQDTSGQFLALAPIMWCLSALQIKLFDHPLPPLEVSAVCSGAAWAATSVILKVKGEQHRLDIKLNTHPS